MLVFLLLVVVNSPCIAEDDDYYSDIGMRDLQSLSFTVHTSENGQQSVEQYMPVFKWSTTLNRFGNREDDVNKSITALANTTGVVVLVRSGTVVGRATGFGCAPRRVCTAFHPILKYTEEDEDGFIVGLQETTKLFFVRSPGPLTARDLQEQYNTLTTDAVVAAHWAPVSIPKQFFQARNTLVEQNAWHSPANRESTGAILAYPLDVLIGRVAVDIPYTVPVLQSVAAEHTVFMLGYDGTPSQKFLRQVSAHPLFKKLHIGRDVITDQFGGFDVLAAHKGKILKESPRYFVYSASSLEGSSGGPVFFADPPVVVALHLGGQRLEDQAKPFGESGWYGYSNALLFQHPGVCELFSLAVSTAPWPATEHPPPCEGKAQLGDMRDEL